MFPRMEWPDIGGVSHSSLSQRGVPAIEVSASSTNLSHQQSIGIDLGNFKFCTRYQIEYI